MQHRKKSEVLDKSNFERLLFKGIKNWKLFTLAFIVCMSVVFLIDRYSAPIYSISSTILLQEKQNDLAGSAADLLFGNQQFKNSMNLNNESIILKSYPLVYEAVKALDFDIVYFKSGNLKTSETYVDVPIKVTLMDHSRIKPLSNLFKVDILSEEYFNLYEQGEDSKQINGKYRFGDRIKYRGIAFKIFANKSIKKNIDNSFLFQIKKLHDITNLYRSKLQIKAGGRETSILTLSINSGLVDKEIDFLTKLTEIYMEQGLREKTKNASRTIEFIDNQLLAIQDSLFSTEGKLERFKISNGIIDLSEEGSYLYNKLEKILAEKTEVTSRLNYYKYLFNYLSSTDFNTDIVIPASAGANDPILNKLVLDLLESQNEKSLIRAEGVESPYLEIINNRTAKLRSDIKSILENLNKSAVMQQNEIEKKWKILQKEINTLPSAEREFIHINRMYEINENLYIFLMEKRAEAAILQASSTPDVKIVNPPMVSGGKIEPQTSQNFGMALLITFLAPVLFLYFKEFFNTKILYKEDIDDVTAIPFLGLVGHENTSENLIVDKNPRSAVSESFRTIRSNINFFTTGKEKKTILITSSVSGEGKTFCSINLSTVFALAGQKTVIVGADLRRPKLFNDFGLTNEVGISNYLVDHAELEDIIQPTPVQNLDLISSGSIPPNPSELLMTERMSELLKTLKDTYDIIILDTPPIGLVTDALILMKYADMTVYLVRQNYTPKGSIMNTQEMFENGQLNNISILFNDVKVQKYGYGYGYGYNYGYNSSYYTNTGMNKKPWYKWWRS